MKKADTLAAIKAKKSQLLNNQLAKEALAVHKTFDDAQKLFKNPICKLLPDSRVILKS